MGTTTTTTLNTVTETARRHWDEGEELGRKGQLRQLTATAELLAHIQGTREVEEHTGRKVTVLADLDKDALGKATDSVVAALAFEWCPQCDCSVGGPQWTDEMAAKHEEEGHHTRTHQTSRQTVNGHRSAINAFGINPNSWGRAGVVAMKNAAATVRKLDEVGAALSRLVREGATQAEVKDFIGSLKPAPTPPAPPAPVDDEEPQGPVVDEETDTGGPQEGDSVVTIDDIAATVTQFLTGEALNDHGSRAMAARFVDKLSDRARTLIEEAFVLRADREASALA